MQVDRLRSLAHRSPFRPVRILLQNGDPIDVRHPENIHITDYVVFALLDPKTPILFEPESVIAVTRLSNGRWRGGHARA